MAASNMSSTLSSSTNAAVNSGIAGGIITSTTNAGMLVVQWAAISYAGSLSGTEAWPSSVQGGRRQISTCSIPLTYGGATLINGGGLTVQNGLNGLTLQDNGALPNTSSVTINYSTLNMSNSGGTLTDSTTRLNPSAPITLNGGQVALFGRANALSSQSIGTVTLNQGQSFLSSAEQSNQSIVGTATLTLASLSRTSGSGATVQFVQDYQNNSAASLGLLGAITGKFIVINNLNGVATTTVGAGLTNNLIGGWATVVNGFFNTNSLEFASYIPTLGVGSLNSAGFAGYDGASLWSPTSPRRTSA